VLAIWKAIPLWLQHTGLKPQSFYLTNKEENKRNVASNLASEVGTINSLNSNNYQLLENKLMNKFHTTPQLTVHGDVEKITLQDGLECRRSWGLLVCANSRREGPDSP